MGRANALPTRWGPAKPETRIRVIEYGPGRWDESDHGLDIPHGIDTIGSKVTGTFICPASSLALPSICRR